MARVFTTSFEFHQKRYDAIVTIISRDGQLNFNVKLLDADLKHFIPDGVIRFQGANGPEQPETNDNNMDQSLVTSVRQAIHLHLRETMK